MKKSFWEKCQTILTTSYDKKGNKKRKVENALKNLRAFITALDKAAPF